MEQGAAVMTMPKRAMSAALLLWAIGARAVTIETGAAPQIARPEMLVQTLRADPMLSRTLVEQISQLNPNTDPADLLKQAQVSSHFDAHGPLPMSTIDGIDMRTSEALRMLAAHPEFLPPDEKACVKDPRSSGCQARKELNKIFKEAKTPLTQIDVLISLVRKLHAAADTSAPLREAIDGARGSLDLQSVGEQDVAGVLARIDKPFAAQRDAFLAARQRDAAPSTSLSPAPAPAAAGVYGETKPVMDLAQLKAYLEQPGKTAVYAQKAVDKLHAELIANGQPELTHEGRKLEGLKVAFFDAGVYHPSYRDMLKQLGYDLRFIKQPSLSDLESNPQDKRVPRGMRWVTPTREAAALFRKSGEPAPHDYTANAMRYLESRHIPLEIRRLTPELWKELRAFYVEQMNKKDGGEILAPEDLSYAHDGTGWAFIFRNPENGTIAGIDIIEEYPGANGKQLWAHFAAYDRAVLGKLNIDSRAIVEEANLAHWLGIPVQSLGIDIAIRGFYRFAWSLFQHKVPYKMALYPAMEMMLLDVIDPFKFSVQKAVSGFNTGKNEGLGLFELSAEMVERYTAHLKAHNSPTALDNLLGGNFFAGDGKVIASSDAMTMVVYDTDPTTKHLPPAGTKLERKPLESLKR